MTATLTFSLPEEQEEFDRAVQGGNWRMVVEDLDAHLRSRLRHEDLPDEVHAALDRARTHLYGLLEERGLNLV
jgi:hypothetical protein